MSIDIVQMRLLGEGVSVEAARRALQAVSSRALHITIQQGHKGQAHPSSIAYGTIMIDTAAQAEPENIALSLTTEQAHKLRAMLRHFRQQHGELDSDLDRVDWQLATEGRGTLERQNSA